MVSFVALLSAIAFAIGADASSPFPPNIGFGAQRLKNFKAKHALVGEPTTCTNVEQYWFKEAVVDNFAPIQDQQYWRGNGQRFWLNKQFWSGPGKL